MNLTKCLASVGVVLMVGLVAPPVRGQATEPGMAGYCGSRSHFAHRTG